MIRRGPPIARSPVVTIVVAIVIVIVGSAAADPVVPATVGFSARLVDEASGDAITGAHHVTFSLFDAETGGAMVWDEARDVEIDDGVLLTSLGLNRPLDGTVFDGRSLWLAITLDDVVMEPRVAIESVPYAVRAGKAADADAVGGVPKDEIQRRVTGSCGVGNFIVAVNPDGTVVCAPDLSGTGDITSVTAGAGLIGGGTAGGVTLSLLTSCTANEVLKWTGTTWACAADANAGGDITGITVGSGLTGGGTTGDVSIALIATCGMGQVLKWSGSNWACGNDLDTDTNSGGDISAVTTNGSSGLVGGGTSGDLALSLLTSCSMNQVLKWNGSAWGCANDVDTDTNAGGDITDVIAGAGLSGGGASGSVTVDVVAGAGISVAANAVSLDVSYTDGRYVNAGGDTMSGALNMNGNRVTNRGCLAGYVVIGPGLCTENADASGFTFSGCANRCRAAGTHMCSSGEMRAIMMSGVVLGVTTTLDWIDDQDADGSALFVVTNNAQDPDSVRATTTSSFCRCCQITE